MRRTLSISVSRLTEDASVTVDPSEKDLSDGRMRALLAAWRRARFKYGRLPSRAELGLKLLESIRDHLIDVDILPEDDFSFRTYGRAIAFAFGRNMVGRRVAELPPSDARLITAVYKLAKVERSPCITRHRPSKGVMVEHWLRLVLPLDDAHTGRVSAFLSLNVPLYPNTIGMLALP
jgi:hypothetical protein